MVGTQRHDLPRVPVQALREAVANAVAHRTYDGASVTVTLRTDSTVTPEVRAWLLSLEPDSSFTAKERQLLLLAVREGSVTNGRARAALGIDSVEARRVLRRLLDRGVLTRHGDRGGAQYHLSPGAPLGTRVFSPSELTATIVDLARTSDYLTNQQVREATGLDRTIVLRALNEMVESGVLVRHGERRGVRYMLAQPRT